MKYTLICCMIFCAVSSSAQDCTPEILAKKAGRWKAGPQGSIHNVTAADLVKEKAVLAAIRKKLSVDYKPTGCEVSYSNVFEKDMSTETKWIADPYQFAMYILPYLCDTKSADKSKYTVAIASATNVNITANALSLSGAGELYAATLPSDDFRGYLKLKQRPQKKDGAWFMGEEVVGDAGTAHEIKESSWLITYNDTLPFYYLSRKEYLQIQLKRLDRAIKESPGEKEYNNKFIKNINDYLERPEAELNQPAICMWNEEERFEKFVDEGTKGSFIAIKPNLDYYHKKLPKSSPQFFTAKYKISTGDEVFEENIANIKKAIDFATLKTMLGK
ncbi:hypothetical protein QWZ08_08050 [Ferruginibacter paludis]|uniref:hypothetical protein n=1 Tax=Ferruginibacter paludis TaxID=1310417 RepID=UPI0025B4DE73|nr:hypothetical protein [Ferruginibacter paludis]MDN3655574.1 hypothetical protein [Ferruginibacter paludis]